MVQEIASQLILEMLQHPLRTNDFNNMDTWKRPMVLDYLSAVLTTTERGKIIRQVSVNQGLKGHQVSFQSVASIARLTSALVAISL